MNEQLDNESNINPDDHEKLMKFLHQQVEHGIDVLLMAMRVKRFRL